MLAADGDDGVGFGELFEGALYFRWGEGEGLGKGRDGEEMIALEVAAEDEAEVIRS